MGWSQIEKLQQERHLLTNRLTTLSALTMDQRNKLPDDSFAVILPGGKKDDTGRTIPRSLRKLPYKTATGSLDRERVINAWAVLNGARGGVELPRELHEKALLVIRKARQKLGLGDERMSTKPNTKKELTTFAKIYDAEEKSALPQSVGEVLSLNDKLITTLEQADGQIQTLTQLNQKLLVDLKSLENTHNIEIGNIKKELEAFKQKEENAKLAQFNAKLTDVTKKWCEVFSLSDPAQQENAKKMLSTFQSEDKLAEIAVFLDHKMSKMADVPRPTTKPSNELVTEQESHPKPTFRQIEQMSETDKKNYTQKLFEQLVKVSNSK